jgi:hypothetical protein
MTSRAEQPTATTVQVPATEADLRAASTHRRELSSQLEQLSDQRNSLMGERHNAVVNQAPQAVIAELDARIKSLGDRVVRIEREKLAADDAIAQALARGVGQSTETTPAPGAPGTFGTDLATTLLNQGMMQQQLAQLEESIRNDYQRKMMVGGTGLVLLAVLVWRWAWSRASARLRREFASSAPAGTPRELKDAVDAIALEVERISENQRFVTKLLSEHPAAEGVKRADARS